MLTTAAGEEEHLRFASLALAGATGRARLQQRFDVVASV